jgi:hypothetical protein
VAKEEVAWHGRQSEARRRVKMGKVDVKMGKLRPGM